MAKKKKTDKLANDHSLSYNLNHALIDRLHSRLNTEALPLEYGEIFNPQEPDCTSMDYHKVECVVDFEFDSLTDDEYSRYVTNMRTNITYGDHYAYLIGIPEGLCKKFVASLQLGDIRIPGEVRHPIIGQWTVELSGLELRQLCKESAMPEKGTLGQEESEQIMQFHLKHSIESGFFTGCRYSTDVHTLAIHSFSASKFLEQERAEMNKHMVGNVYVPPGNTDAQQRAQKARCVTRKT